MTVSSAVQRGEALERVRDARVAKGLPIKSYTESEHADVCAYHAHERAQRHVHVAEAPVSVSAADDHHEQTAFHVACAMFDKSKETIRDDTMVRAPAVLRQLAGIAEAWADLSAVRYSLSADATGWGKHVEVDALGFDPRGLANEIEARRKVADMAEIIARDHGTAKAEIYRQQAFAALMPKPPAFAFREHLHHEAVRVCDLEGAQAILDEAIGPNGVPHDLWLETGLANCLVDAQLATVLEALGDAALRGEPWLSEVHKHHRSSVASQRNQDVAHHAAAKTILHAAPSPVKYRPAPGIVQSLWAVPVKAGTLKVWCATAFPEVFG